MTYPHPALRTFIHKIPLYDGFGNPSSKLLFLSFKTNYNPIHTEEFLAQKLTSIDAIFYTFQGLSSDGKYYVSVIFPISHPELPAVGYEIPGGDFEAFESNYESYITDIEALLNNAPDTAFLPDIQLLDELIESLYVDVE